MATSRIQKIWVTPAPLAERKSHGTDCYKIEYSEFSGVVFVCFDSANSRIDSVEFCSISGHSISAEDFRKFPMMAVEILIKNGGNYGPRPDGSRPEIEKASYNRMDRSFLESITDFYLDSLTRNERPIQSISNHLGVPSSTAARWVGKCREEGILK